MSLSFGKIDYWGNAIPGRPQELSYITQIPLPIEDISREAKIKARCMGRMTILEPSKPTRDEVRKINYDRRTDQINNQGFVSLKQRPYRAIGHPVYIDNKKLITDALGLPHQENEYEQSKPSTPSSSLEEGERPESKYMLRRSKKQLNTLRKEIERGRNLLRNVKLGHGLFKVLEDEWTKTISQRESDAALAKQKAMMNWQMAKSSGSESESEDELQDYFDVSKEFVDIEVPEYAQQEDEPTEDLEHVRFMARPETYSGHTNTDNEPSHSKEKCVRAKSVMTTASPRRRKGAAPRPYTPVHGNISQKKHQTGEIHGETLFKQLCCLHWILKAMDIAETVTMSPLITCWELNADKMGGIELNKRTIEDKKQREQLRYDNLFKPVKPKEIKKAKPRTEKRRSTFYPSRLSRSGSIAQSIRSRSGSIAHSQGSETMTLMNDNSTSGLDDSRFDHDSNIIEEQIFEAPITVPPPITITAPDNELAASTRPPTRQPGTGARSSLLNITREELKQQELAKQLEEAAKMDSTPMERLSHSRMYRATASVKPKSSKELLEFKASCKSSKLINQSQDLKQSWAEVKEERALRLHDELDYQEKNRLKTCQDKFSAMETSENSFHRALKNMRLKSEHKRRESEKEKNQRQDQSKYAKWYDELTSLVPADCSSQWYFKNILNKLRIFGITESSSKASEHKFTRVLRLIRSWEICSPNIAVAVEFCRDRIIEMNEEDFEDLFHHLFPAIERPKTAPAKSSR
ncbi:coiled-coil domain-containing protein 60-like isoform X2 [Watersipora subatra]|uniref:coiled-coil domain-containing protein 60-like isoform X2 n=1 Tax=Watersipora subatra TaxID=2589382 RepID=UPI00355B95D1